MYNVSRNDVIFSEFKTNATYFQVACGIYAALSVMLLDQIPKGAYYVDELLLKTDNHYGDYLKYYMRDFVVGENQQSEGLLHQRIKSHSQLNVKGSSKKGNVYQGSLSIAPVLVTLFLFACIWYKFTVLK